MSLLYLYLCVDVSNSCVLSRYSSEIVMGSSGDKSQWDTYNCCPMPSLKWQCFCSCLMWTHASAHCIVTCAHSTEKCVLHVLYDLCPCVYSLYVILQQFEKCKRNVHITFFSSTGTFASLFFHNFSISPWWIQYFIFIFVVVYCYRFYYLARFFLHYSIILSHRSSVISELDRRGCEWVTEDVHTVYFLNY